MVSNSFFWFQVSVISTNPKCESAKEEPCPWENVLKQRWYFVF